MNTGESSLPPTFRADVLEKVVPSLLAGECCSLIGVSGVGKSNFSRFLSEPEARTAYFPGNQTWPVLVDSHSLVFGEQPTEFVVLELMIHRLIVEAESRPLDEEFLTTANELYTHLVEHPTGYIAFRYLERLCARLCKQHGLRLVFIFDQFDDLWQRAESRVFLNLRNLRDQFKYQVVYLVMTRHRLQNIRQDLAEVEAFWELFSAHTYGLGMYSKHDAVHMLERMASRAGISLTDALREELMQYSGCHPGLLRAAFWAHERSVAEYNNLTNLARVASVAEECAKIWSDLAPNEQHLVRAIALNSMLGEPDIDTLAVLRLKGIVVGNEPLTLFSPIFRDFVVDHSSRGSEDGVVVDPRLHQVRLNGKVIDRQLGPLEFSLAEYLARHAGSVCTTQNILHHLYPDEGYYSNSDQRLDAILSRLREALGEDGHDPRFIIRHRKAGIQLTRGSIAE